MKNLLPITLTARRGNLKKFVARRHNDKFLSIQKKVFERDGYACRYCGFQVKDFLEVVNIDNNYDHNTLSNMATACSFCTQCLFLDGVGTLPRTGGVIVFIPELSQADLNNFCRVLFCSMDKETIYKNKLHSVYLSLKERSSDVEKSFGPETSNPKVFGQSLIDAQLTAGQLDHDALQHLRLLPNRKDFKKEIDYWKKTVFANIPL